MGGSVGGTHQWKAFEVKREQTINFRKMLMLIQTTGRLHRQTENKVRGGGGHNLKEDCCTAMHKTFSTPKQYLLC
jgi:hypothetical protein